MKTNNLIYLLGAAGLLLLFSCEEPDLSLAALPSNASGLSESKTSPANGTNLPESAIIRFGDENAGSPFPPQEGHDESIHASDKMVPRAVVIAQGGSVTFHLHPFHQAAIYAPGTQPEDIDLSQLEDLTVPFFIPDFIINDPDGRVALSPPLSPEEFAWTTPDGTFDEPGRYLVICTTLPHFVAADMYGWVTVR